MTTLLVRLLAGAAFLVLVFWMFRLAMGLRYAKLVREEERRRQEAGGRRLVAEVPNPDGEVVLFLEDAVAFHWGARSLPKAEIVGVRLILNGRVVEEGGRPGRVLPAVGWPTEYDGGERWDVRLELADAGPLMIPCGKLREGVSREAAQQVFASVARAVAR